MAQSRPRVLRSWLLHVLPGVTWGAQGAAKPRQTHQLWLVLPAADCGVAEQPAVGATQDTAEGPRAGGGIAALPEGASVDH